MGKQQAAAVTADAAAKAAEEGKQAAPASPASGWGANLMLVGLHDNLSKQGA